MSPLTQSITVIGLNLRNLKERIGSSSVAIFGVAGVVTVFLSVLSIAEGFQKVLHTVGSNDTAIVLRAGADDEMSSILSRADTVVVGDASGVLHGAGGPVASAELFVIVDLPKRSTGTDANVPFRGVQPAAFEVRKKLRIVEGRRFEPGRNEIVAGRGAARQFAGLDVGTTLRKGRNEWKVVGIFEADGGIAESELWADAAVLAPAYHRGDSFQAIYVKLTSPEAFDNFKDALTTNPQLNVKVLREVDYLSAKSQYLTRFIYILGYPIAALMGIAAVFGALNTMYNAVAVRTREIATLRALGFGGAPVVISVLVEALLLGLVGGLAGGVTAYLAFNGYQTSTLNWQTFSQVAFAFAVTPRLLVQGIVYALLMGLIGGIFPAIRAARLPVATALREL